MAMFPALASFIGSNAVRMAALDFTIGAVETAGEIAGTRIAQYGIDTAKYATTQVKAYAEYLGTPEGKEHWARSMALAKQDLQDNPHG